MRQTVGLVVTGLIGSGITTFMTNAPLDYQIEPRPPRGLKMLWGEITLDEDLKLNIQSVPGVRAYAYMLDILQHSSLGAIILVDSTRPDTFEEAQWLFRSLVSVDVCMVVANKQDIEDALPVEVVAQSFPNYPIRPCNSTHTPSIKEVMKALLFLILEEWEQRNP